MNILKKLNRIQYELKVPKGQLDSSGKFSYRSCEDILEAVKPFLLSEGLVLTLSDEVIQLGARHYIKATATLHDMDSGEAITNTANAREPDRNRDMDASQLTGTASSYARKYALGGLFGLDDSKDADTDEYSGKAPTPVCEECGEAIAGIIYDGKKYSADEVAVKIKETHGRLICSKCQKDKA